VEAEAPVVTISAGLKKHLLLKALALLPKTTSINRMLPLSQPNQLTKSFGRAPVPYELPCVRELLRFLLSLINLLERMNNKAMIHVGLRLPAIAVETGADVIDAVPSLQTPIQYETCRSLFLLLNFK
jgi:brefeldin A-resistance guanine nucleotide exchange factor 1